MPTPAERRALLFVAAVAALGLAVRGGRALVAARGGEPDDRAALAAQIAAVDSAVAAGGRPRRAAAGRPPPADARATPSAPAPGPSSPVSPATTGRPIDLDRASAEELDALPGIGPALAARIVADRAANGPFGSVQGLQRVKGIGPALAERLEPLVTFSGTVTGSRYPHP